MYVAHERRVLAVDDDPAYLAVLKLCMRTCGFTRVYAASDGCEALNYLESLKFDLVLSDWNMAPMDGLELLREIRQVPSMAKTPVILMTANLSEVAWREAIRLGATDFLLKPFSLATLRLACQLSSGAAQFESPEIAALQARLAPQSGRDGRAEPPIEADVLTPASAARETWINRLRRFLSPRDPQVS